MQNQKAAHTDRSGSQEQEINPVLPSQGLYVLTQNIPDLVEKTEEILASGIAVLQYRDKNLDKNKRLREAETLAELARKYDTLFLVNDDPYLAQAVEADGVHLGRYDASHSLSKQILGEKSIIGVSSYNDLSRALLCNTLGVDYLAFGSIFPSKTKPYAQECSLDLLSSARELVNLPLVAIGGITPENAPSVLSRGVGLLAVSSAIYQAENPANVVASFNEQLQKRQKQND